MRDLAVRALNDEGKHLLERIEEFAGQQIHFVDGRKDLSIPEYARPEGGAKAACHPTQNGARIILYSQDELTHAVTHEMLHIERYWCKRVPQLYRADGNENQSDRFFAHSVESFLEHLVIIPREHDYRLSNWGMWGKAALTYWKGFDPKVFHSPIDLKFHALTRWMHSTEDIVSTRVQPIRRGSNTLSHEA